MADGERVFVSGGAGYIGSNVARAFAAAGNPVRVLARSADRARAGLPADVEIVEGDIRDAATVARCVADAGLVYHFVSTFRHAGIPDQEHRDVNVGGTEVLLEAARAAAVRRFVHCSTIGVLGHIARPPADEETAYNPGDIYQDTKTEAERLALECQRGGDLPLVIIRPTSVYGPGDRRLLKLFRMIARRRFVMVGSGEACFHMIHIEDLVRGFQVAAEHPQAVGDLFILGGPEYCTLRDLTARLARIVDAPPPRLRVPARPVQWAGSLCEAVCTPLGIEPPLYRRRVDFFTKSRAFTTAKAERVLGYTPRIALDDGLRQTAAWYREQGWL